MLQAIGESLGAFGRLDRTARGNRSRDPHQLALDPGLDTVGRAPDQRIQPAHREFQPIDRRGGIAAGAVVIERDHVPHDATIG